VVGILIASVLSMVAAVLALVRPRTLAIALLLILPFHYWVKMAGEHLPGAFHWLGTYWKEAIVAGLCLRMLITPGLVNRRLLITPLMGTILAFQIIILLRAPFAADYRLSAVGTGYLLVYSVLFYALCAFFTGPKAGALITTFLVTAVIVAVIGILEFAFDFSVTGRAWLGTLGEETRRIRSIIGAAIQFGSYMALLLPIVLAKFLTSRNSLRRTLWFGAMILMTAGLLLSYSRGPMLQAFLGCGGVLWFYRGLLAGVKSLYLGLSLFCIVAVGSLLVVEKDVFIERLQNVFSLRDEGNETRVDIYASIMPEMKGWQGARQLLFGRGIGTASNAVLLLDDAGAGGEGYILDIESSILKIFFEAGLVGLAIFAGMYVLVLRTGLRSIRLAAHQENRPLLVGVTCALFAFPVELAINRLIESWIISATMWTFIAYLYIQERDAVRTGSSPTVPGNSGLAGGAP
jgi:hypothetical protein